MCVCVQVIINPQRKIIWPGGELEKPVGYQMSTKLKVGRLSILLCFLLRVLLFPVVCSVVFPVVRPVVCPVCFPLCVLLCVCV